MIKLTNQPIIKLPASIIPSEDFLQKLGNNKAARLKVYFNPFTAVFSMGSKKASQNDLEMLSTSELNAYLSKPDSLRKIKDRLSQDLQNKLIPVLRAEALKKASDMNLYDIMTDPTGLIHWLNPTLSKKDLFALAIRPIHSTIQGLSIRAANNFHYLPIHVQQLFYSLDPGDSYFRKFARLKKMQDPVSLPYWTWPDPIHKAMIKNVAQTFRPDQLKVPISLNYWGGTVLYTLKKQDLFSKKPVIGNYHNPKRSQAGLWKQFSKRTLKEGFQHLSIELFTLDELNNFLHIANDPDWKEALSAVSVTLNEQLAKGIAKNDLSDPDKALVLKDYGLKWDSEHIEIKTIEDYTPLPDIKDPKQLNAPIVMQYALRDAMGLYTDDVSKSIMPYVIKIFNQSLAKSKSPSAKKLKRLHTQKEVIIASGNYQIAGDTWWSPSTFEERFIQKDPSRGLYISESLPADLLNDQGVYQGANVQRWPENLQQAYFKALNRQPSKPSQQEPVDLGPSR